MLLDELSRCTNGSLCLLWGILITIFKQRNNLRGNSSRRLLFWLCLPLYFCASAVTRSSFEAD